MGADRCGEECDHLPASAYTRFRDLRITKQLGSGMYGTVRMAVNKTNKAPFAVKVVRKSSLTKPEMAAVKNEVQIMSQLHHPNSTLTARARARAFSRKSDSPLSLSRARSSRHAV